jgi:hypothetical protein
MVVVWQGDDVSMDFTIKRYRQLLTALSNAGYKFQTFAGFLKNPMDRSVVLRHDVDARKLNSLQFSKIQAEKNIRGSYYFRIVTQSFDEKVIRDIASLGHEIGYHYETMDSARGNVDKAYEEFCRNLETFRRIIPVQTICMHGSPLSKHDNRDLWKKYDYKKLGLIGEPYFDIDFNKVLYLTDTGRRWNGEKVSIRDKVGEIRDLKSEVRSQKLTQNPKPKTQNYNFRSTKYIIRAADNGQLPDQIMMTFHPQRWTDKPLPWMKELVWQNAKNVIKQMIVK